MVTSSRHKVLAASIIGNIFEWYDFSIYGFLALNIASLFFPSENRTTALLLTFSTLALGYLVRPLGAIILGHLGDRFGRSIALRISIYGMAISTLLMGFLPTYNQIGLYSTFMLILLRILQGISAGGELIGSIVYNFEIAPANKKTLWCSWAAFGSTLGVLLGSLTVTALNHTFSAVEIMNGGWRIPYFFGVFLAIFSIVARKYLPETDVFKKIPQKKSNVLAVLEAIKKAPKSIFQVIGCNVFNAISFCTLFIWMPIFLQLVCHLDRKEASFNSTIALVIYAIFIPIMGFLGDRYGRYRIATAGLISIGLLAYPLFKILMTGSTPEIISVLVIFAILFGLWAPTSAVIAASLFPPEYRYSGYGFSYNISMSLFGGTVPLFCTYLITQTKLTIAPALYISASAVVGLVAMISIIRSRRTVTIAKPIG